MELKKIDIKNQMLTRARALGNSKRGLKEVCSDLVNQHGVKGKDLARLQDGTFLCASTLQRIADLSDTEMGDPYRPNAETCERILRYFGAEIHFEQVNISQKYQNKAKSKD